MGQYFLGIDIRPGGIAAVLLKRTLKGACFESQAYVPVTDADDPAEHLVPALELIKQKLPWQDATCVASYPADRLFYRNLVLPFKEAGKIRQALPFELEPTLPRPPEDLIIDFVSLREGSRPGAYPVLAAVGDSGSLKAWLDLFTAAGLEPRLLVPGSFSTALALQSLEEIPEGAALIDLSSQTVTLMLLCRKEACLIRSFPLTLFHDGEKDTAQRIARHLAHTMAAFGETQDQAFELEKVFLAGDPEGEAGLAEPLSRALGIPVENLHLAGRLRGSILHLPVTGWDSGRMDSALALALAGLRKPSLLNFRQGALARQNQWLAHKADLIRTGVLAAMVLVLALGNLFLGTHALQSHIDTLDRRIHGIFRSTFPDVTRIQDPLSQMKLGIRELEDSAFFDDADDGQMPALLAINTISRLIPREVEVELNNLVLNPENIIIAGHTDTFNSVDAMKNGLEKSEFFTKVTISSATIDRSGNGVNFKLNIEP